MKIVITTLDNLPEYCHDCPCCHDGYCKADKEHREAQPYRPFWCPLHEEKEEAIPKNSVYCKNDVISTEHPGLIYSVPFSTSTNIRVSCDMCGKVIEREYLTALNDNSHLCKDCERRLTEECKLVHAEHMDEEKIRVVQCDRCGKIVERSSLITVIKIRHGGTSTVNYPHNGEFIICKKCEQWLLKQLTNNKEEEQK